jgi:lipoprotein-anchoring transpeptidase ErfK/SrfK
VENLRRRSEAKQKKPRRRLYYAAAGLILVLFILISGAFIWGQTLSSLVAQTLDGEAMVEAPGATNTPVAVAAATGDPAERFVSGQFAPKQATGPQAAGSLPDEPSPTATPTAQPLAPKTAGKSGNDPRPTWTMTPSPTYTPTPTATPVPTFVSDGNTSSGLVVRPDGVGPDERWIDVNLTTQTLVAYEGDTPVFDSRVSSGTWQYPTVTGQFRVWLRYTEQTMDGRRLGYDYYLPNVPYVMYFYEDYALHGTYWHNNFGTPMSHGCVNLPTTAAEWIFNWSTMGTLVNVHY